MKFGEESSAKVMVVVTGMRTPTKPWRIVHPSHDSLIIFLARKKTHRKRC
jgi:hypothetical protein